MSLDWDDEGTSAVNAEQVDSDVDTSKRVNASDKRMINATTDVNQLVPFKYKWAWDQYLKACENQWMPQEYIMEQDVAQWNSGSLSEQEKQLVIRNLGLLTLNDRAGGLAIGIYRHVTAPEVRQYLLRQGMEEAIRHHVYYHVSDALKIDEQAVYDTYNSFASVRAKNEFIKPYLNLFQDPQFKTGTPESDAQFLKSLVVYACILKGLFSTVSFTQMLTLGRNGKMVKTSEQYQLMLRDELTHFKAAANIVSTIRIENPHLWQPIFADVTALIRKAVELEFAVAKETLPADILGMNADMFLTYLQSVANQRAAAVGIGVLFPGAKNPFPWFAEAFGLRNEGGTAVAAKAVEAKTGGTLNWE